MDFLRSVVRPTARGGGAQPGEDEPVTVSIADTIEEQEEYCDRAAELGDEAKSFISFIEERSADAQARRGHEMNAG